MAGDLVNLVADRVQGEIARYNAMSDQELLAHANVWLNEQTGSGLYSASPEERFKQWVESTLLPRLKRLGDSGQRAWDMICDPDSEFSKDRISSILLTLAVVTGFQHLDFATLLAIVVMAIRYKSPKR